MRFLSLFSGIEAATCAWSPLGWECAAVAEVEPFPCSLLKHHYPTVPNLGDVTKITHEQVSALGHLDLVCGGFPCQDLSVAGLRKGLKNADGSATRSGLFFTAMQIAEWANSRWLFIENVPGMLSSNSGRDFAAVVGEMAGCEFDVPRDGWRNAGVVAGPKGLVEWTVMDAQYHGLAQRRRRVFLIRDSGDWANRPPIFLESYRLQGHPAPRRQAGQRPTGTRSARTEGGGGLGTDFECSGGLVSQGFGGEIAPTLNAAFGSKLGLDNQHIDGGAGLFIAHTLRGEGFDASKDGTGRGTPLVPVTVPTLVSNGDAHSGFRDEHGLIAFDTTQMTSTANYSNPKAGDPCHPLAAQAHVPCIAFPERMSGTQCASTENLAPSMGALNPTAVAYTTKLHNTTSNNAGKIFEERTACLDANSPPPALLTAMQVRRMTPGECESLQGFPQGYTAVTHRGKPAADGPRYKALGNSWAVPNVRWLGERIDAVASINKAQVATNSVDFMQQRGSLL